MSDPTVLWLAPTLTALVAWGIAQGLVKKYIGEVSAERFCLYYAIANATVNLAFWAWHHDAPPPFAPPCPIAAWCAACSAAECAA